MNKIVLVAMMGAICAGCFSEIGVGAALNGHPVVVAEGCSLEQAVISAAGRRGWMVEKLGANEFRLTINQRDNRCVVKVVTSGSRFSVLPVESNIAVRKYDQWVKTLAREITYRASNGK